MNLKLDAVIHRAFRTPAQRNHLSSFLYLLPLALASVLPSFAANIAVANTNDSGAGSLRNAIAAANSGDTITFANGVTGTITLTTGMLTINKSVTITGPGAAQLALNGNQMSPVFDIGSGATVILSGLTIENGNGKASQITGQGSAGGIINAGTLSLSNSTLSGNTNAMDPGQSGALGGGIYNTGTLTVSNSTLSGNSGTYGGGITNYGTVTVTQSTLSANSADEGGGIFNNNGSQVTLINCTLSGNSTVQGGGGGIENAGTMTLTNSTVAGNSAPSGGGGGIESGSSLTLKSSLLANNGSSGNCSFYDDIPFVSDGYNLSDDATCGAALTQPSDINNKPAGLSPKGLQNNGGPTQTIGLLTGLAVDHIPVADCTDANGNPVKTDQRGVSRPQGPACDIGAYELVQAVPFESFHPSLAIDDGKHPGFILTSSFTLGSASTGLNPATEAMTLQIANYTLTLPAGSFHQLWNASNAPYGYEGTVNGVTLVLGLVPLGNNTFSFDAAGAPVSFPGIKNPVTVTLTFGNDSGTANVQALITSF